MRRTEPKDFLPEESETVNPVELWEKTAGKTSEPLPLSGRIKKLAINSCILTGILGAITIGLMALLGAFGKNTAEEFNKAACDACFISGMITISLAVLIFCIGEGTFRMIGFAIRGFAGVFNNKIKKESYREYSERKQKQKFKITDVLPLLVAGSLFLIAATVFLLI